MVTAGGWLVAIDMQAVFADPASGWAVPRFAAAAAGIDQLRPAFRGRTLHTRFVAPAEPTGAWREYYRRWPWALQPPDAPLYDLVGDPGGPVLTRPAFGKWGPELDAATAGSRDLVLAGVSTDCCVLSTALAAADDGVRVRVAADACAGATDADHERALAAMALYAPLITVTTVDALLGPG
ncbi:MAG: cysteine hydrolase [Mycobacteriales bacterium]